jgi:hypothetical protein
MRSLKQKNLSKQLKNLNINICVKEAQKIRENYSNLEELL